MNKYNLKQILKGNLEIKISPSDSNYKSYPIYNEKLDADIVPIKISLIFDNEIISEAKKNIIIKSY